MLVLLEFSVRKYLEKATVTGGILKRDKMSIRQIKKIFHRIFGVKKLIYPEFAGANLRERTFYGYLEAWVSIVGNTVLFVVKLLLGRWINSITLIADSFHTLSDVITSVVVLLGFRIAKRPADSEHPFGHGRMETIASLIIAVLLVMVGVEFAQSSYQRLIRIPPVGGNTWIIIVMLVSALLKEWMARFSIKLGKRIDSSVLIADAWHHRSDAWASLLGAIAVVTAMWGYPRVDAFLGLIVSGLIIYTGWKLGKSAVSNLLGKAPTQQMLARIVNQAKSWPGVQEVHEVLVHNYGVHNVISLHVEVDKKMGISNSHKIATAIEERLSEIMDASTIVHIDPVTSLATDLQEVEKELKGILDSYSQIRSYHGIHILARKGEKLVRLHILVDPGMTVVESHELSHQISVALSKKFPKFKLDIHVEPGR